MRLFTSQARPMSSRLPQLSVIVGGCLLCLSAQAIDLLTAYQSAIHNNLGWHAQQEQFAAQQQNVPIAFGKLLPQAQLSATTQRNRFEPELMRSEQNPFAASGDTTSSATQVGVGVRQALYRPADWEQYQLTKVAVATEALTLIQERQRLTQQVVQAYLGVLRAQAIDESLTSQIELLQEQNKAMQARLAAGVVARVDTLEVDAQLKTIQANQALAQSRITDAKNALGVLIGQPVKDVQPLQNNAQLQRLNPEPLNYWLTKAQTGNLELRIAYGQLQQGIQRQSQYQANRYPTVDLIANAGYNDSTNPLQTSSNGNSYSIGIEANLPILTGGRAPAAVRQAAYQAKALEDSYLLTYQQVSNQTSQYWREMQAQQQTVAARQNAVNANRSTAKAAKVGYDLGVKDILDVLTLQQRLFDSQINLINAKYDYLLAYTNLNAVAGTLDDSVVVEINHLIEQAIS